jgi:hypothetical protein
MTCFCKTSYLHKQASFTATKIYCASDDIPRLWRHYPIWRYFSGRSGSGSIPVNQVANALFSWQFWNCYKHLLTSKYFKIFLRKVYVIEDELDQFEVKLAKII